VQSNSGHTAFTDTLGKYSIAVGNKDSLAFTYNGKSTIKFSVDAILNTIQFDVALQVNYKSKYKTLKEVIVRSRTYKEDSIANRQLYAKVFNYNKPSFETSITPGGGVGADVNEIINMFRFKRNKRLRAFQNRLEQQEEDNYINYRFSKRTVKRITQLDGEELNYFMIRYRPTYSFVSQATELILNQYILQCYYNYKGIVVDKELIKQ
jgi:hypothetical protein